MPGTESDPSEMCSGKNVSPVKLVHWAPTSSLPEIYDRAPRRAWPYCQNNPFPEYIGTRQSQLIFSWIPDTNCETMSQIYKVSTERLQDETQSRYDPKLCKTCQKIGVESPEIARVPYGDCETHFRRRVDRLWRTGVTILSKYQ